MANETKSFDVVIVGGGSAGTVLANRLTQDPVKRVLLLEAGKANAPSEYPDVIANANRIGGDQAHDWGYHTHDHLGLDHDVTAIRGNVLGGSSGVNAAVAIRARPSDFARWAALGIDGWSFEDVLPIFKGMENTPTGDDAWHGRSGPFPILRPCSATSRSNSTSASWPLSSGGSHSKAKRRGLCDWSGKNSRAPSLPTKISHRKQPSPS
jgi:choline dehydrogenase